ncbi:MAG: ABC transporter substrate-binding protein [Mycoplasmatales bacterium]
MKKLIFSLTLMLLVLVGCGSAAGSNDEVETVTWTTIGVEPADEQMVEDAMNEILEPAVGAKIDIIYYDYSEYTDKLNLKFEANDPMDIVFAPSWTVPYEENAKAGKYVDLDKYIDDGTLKDTYDAVNPQFWEGAKIDDTTYAVPTNKELAPQEYVLLDQDLVDKYDFDVDSVKTYQDVVPFLEEVTEGEGYPAYFNDLNWTGIKDKLSYDCVSALQNQVCLDPDNPEDGYQWVFDMPAYVDGMSFVNDMIDEGIMDSNTLDIVDIATADYGMITQSGYPGANVTWEQSFGRDYAAIPMATPIITTDNTRASLNVIAASSPHPDLAAKVLNEMNTNSELRTLFAYGIEGEHYTKNDKDELVFTDQQENYITGVYTQGNFFILPLLEGEPEDKWEEFDVQNENSIISPALGFSPDLSEYTAEIANILNMEEKHKVPLELGNFDDMDADIESARSDLDSVGLFEVIDEVNAQYEAWQKENA